MRLFPARSSGEDRGVELNDDYDKFGPSDKQFEETGPDARVYRVYMKEAAAFDKNLVDENKDGLDVILVFAGLFSAVVTTFLVQASLNLQQDQTAVSSSLLYELVQIQRASAQGESVDNVPTSSLQPNTDFTPDTISAWVNGLWACSLVASLCVALFAVLVKQWLHHYDSFSSGDTRYRSHRRQYRYLGFEQWRVTTITGLLPIIMHGSLALFLIGLVIFYIPLLLPLAVAIAVITAVAFLLYFISNILPIFNPQCPYQTPLTQFLCFTIAFTHRLLLTRRQVPFKRLLSLTLQHIPSPKRLLLVTQRHTRLLFHRCFGSSLPLNSDLSTIRESRHPVASRRFVWHPVFTQFLCFARASTRRFPLFSQHPLFRRFFISSPLWVSHAITTSFHSVCSWSQRLSSQDSFLQPMKERESKEIQDRCHELAVESLHWLFTTSPNPRIHSIVVQALGGLDPDSEPWIENIFTFETLNDVYAVQECVFGQSTLATPRLEHSVQPGCEDDVERIMRSFTVLPRNKSYFVEDWLIDVSALTPAIAASVYTSTYIHFSEQQYSLSSAPEPKVLLPIVISPNLVLKTNQWKAAFSILFQGHSFWDLCQSQIASFFVLILSSPKSNQNLSFLPKSQSTQSVDVAAFVKTRDDSFWHLFQKLMDVFTSAQSAVNPVPHSSDAKVCTVMKLVVFALNGLCHKSSADAANRAMYLKLLAESLDLLESLLHPGLVRDMFESFPSLCTVLINRTKILETEENDERQVLNLICKSFLEFCGQVLKPAPDYEPPLSPPLLIHMLLFCTRSCIVNSDHPLRSMKEEEYKATVLRALDTMSSVLHSGSEDALLTFVREDWIQFLCGWVWLDEKWTHSNWRFPAPALKLIDAFIQGLNKYSDVHHQFPIHNGEDISHYIFKDHNLLFSILFLVVDSRRRNSPSPRRQLNQMTSWLARLRRSMTQSQVASMQPDRVEWVDVLRALKDTLSWLKIPRGRGQSDEFPLKEIFRDFRERTDCPGRRLTGHSTSSNAEEVSLEECIERKLVGDSNWYASRFESGIKFIEDRPVTSNSLS